MNPASTRLPDDQFRAGARSLIRSLRDAFLRDEDLVDDLNVVLDAGPMGLPGTKHQRRARRKLFGCASSEPSSRTVRDLGRAVTRLDRILGHLVAIAQEREWEPPYPNVAGPIARANALRRQSPWAAGEVAAEEAHLRRMALVALALLDELSMDEPDKAPAVGTASRADGSRT